MLFFSCLYNIIVLINQALITITYFVFLSFVSEAKKNCGILQEAGKNSQRIWWNRQIYRARVFARKYDRGLSFNLSNILKSSHILTSNNRFQWLVTIFCFGYWEMKLMKCAPFEMGLRSTLIIVIDSSYSFT